MPLDGNEVARLAEVIEAQWDIQKLQLFAGDNFDVDLAGKVPQGGVLERAFWLISNNNVPPRDRILLETLEKHGNAAIRAVAKELLEPKFFSPSGDPHDAIVLGRTAFVDREDLRMALHLFTDAQTRVLIVRGPDACGKSYTWQLLRHLAWLRAGATAVRLQLKGGNLTPRKLVTSAFSLLDLDWAKLPPMTDEPQEAHVNPLVAAFTGQIVKLPRRYWLVVDDLNDAQVAPVVRETAYAMARAVEETVPPNLWMALLGYNTEITDPDLRYVARDDARFYEPGHLARHFEMLAAAGPRPLTPARARTIAEVLMRGFPERTKESMAELTIRVEAMGEKLKMGLQP